MRPGPPQPGRVPPMSPSRSPRRKLPCPAHRRPRTARQHEPSPASSTEPAKSSAKRAERISAMPCTVSYRTATAPIPVPCHPARRAPIAAPHTMQWGGAAEQTALAAGPGGPGHPRGQGPVRPETAATSTRPRPAATGLRPVPQRDQARLHRLRQPRPHPDLVPPAPPTTPACRCGSRDAPPGPTTAG